MTDNDLIRDLLACIDPRAYLKPHQQWALQAARERIARGTALECAVSVLNADRPESPTVEIECDSGHLVTSHAVGPFGPNDDEDGS